MQFLLLLDEAMNKNQTYLQLSQKLTQMEEKCLQNAENQQQRMKCQSKRDHFRQYYDQYCTQYKEKGRNMCTKSMKDYHDINQKLRIKNQCIVFYAKSIPLFEQNVIDKLKSLVQSTDFSQL